MNRQSGHKRNRTDNILTNWDASISAELSQKFSTLSERRDFLAGMLKSGAALVSMPLWAGLSGCERQAAQQQILQSDPWRTFSAVQQQLFPDDGNGPSASDIHAPLYLKFVLEAADTDGVDKKFLLDGIQWLNALTDKELGKAFVELDIQSQDKALQKIASSTAGERWLSHLLLYIMEALLTDPVYSANPDGTGWRWLEHQAGFPRPPKNKTYTELL